MLVVGSDLVWGVRCLEWLLRMVAVRKSNTGARSERGAESEVSVQVGAVVCGVTSNLTTLTQS